MSLPPPPEIEPRDAQEALTAAVRLEAIAAALIRFGQGYVNSAEPYYQRASDYRAKASALRAGAK